MNLEEYEKQIKKLFKKYPYCPDPRDCKGHAVCEDCTVREPCVSVVEKYLKHEAETGTLISFDKDLVPLILESDNVEKCKKCGGDLLGHENMETGLCRKCWLNTIQEHKPGYDMTGAEWENFMESE